MNKYTVNIHFIVFETYLTWEIRMVGEWQGKTSTHVKSETEFLEFINNKSPTHTEAKIFENNNLVDKN